MNKPGEGTMIYPFLHLSAFGRMAEACNGLAQEVYDGNR
jgi:hypothetical protein